MRKFCEIIANYCVKNDIIQSDDMNVLRFGIELVITQLITIGSILLIGLFISEIVQCILFCICFILSRKVFEGYHASTFLRCFLLTNLFYLFVEAVINIKMPYYYLNIISSFFIYQQFKFYDKKRFKIILFILFYSMCICFFYLNQNIQYVNLYSLILFLVLCLGEIQIGVNKDEYSYSGRSRRIS